MTYDTILIPTDGSTETTPAFEHGLAIAERFDASVHALYVVDLGYSEAEFPDDDAWRSVYEDAEREANAALDDLALLAQERSPTISVVRSIRHGHPAQVVLDTIEETATDLVVMGPRRTSRIRRLFVGSTTERVVRASPVPVLTLRAESDETATERGDPTTEYADILVATDGSPGSARAVEHAVALAAEYEATLHAISVVERRYARSSFREFVEDEGYRALRSVLDRAAEAGVHVRTELVEGVPHEAIVEYVADHGVDLVVVGTHGRTGLDRLVLGSVAAHVVQTASVPVVTVPSAAHSDAGTA
ncbi:universal stress protein [Halomarina salina]|uniref:Universal stress protein n=1 Tax=Halomarina salina TaxID=1872699 RepID=A0ABD5RP25_9EURY